MELRVAQVKKYFKSRVGSKDEAIENFFASDLDVIRNRAASLGILEGDITLKPLQIMIPDQFLDQDMLYRLDKTDTETTLRYSQASVTTLFYDEARLYYHQCNLDLLTGQISDDVFGEFAFIDVVTMETFLTDGPDEDEASIRLDLEIQLTNGSELIITLRRELKTKDTVFIAELSPIEREVLKTIKQLVRQTF
jgi:hypothetical protein